MSLGENSLARIFHEPSSMVPASRRLLPLPHEWSYPTAGFLLAFGAPVGYFVLRSLTRGESPTALWIAAELSSQAQVYLYLWISTTAVFVLLGWYLGRKEDLLQRSSLTDPLTSLANRRHLELRLNEELARARRYEAPLSLLLIDVDRLKEINDRGGHQAGDEALEAVAQELRRCCRATDIPARFGGDEFAILSPFTTAADALELGERIRTAVRRESEATVSVGIADLDSVTEPTPKALMRAADYALYEAKDAGRDRVVRADPAHSDRSAVGISSVCRSQRCKLRHTYAGETTTSGEMRVYCPVDGASVDVEQCLTCPRWRGLYLDPTERQSFLECSVPDENASEEKRPSRL